MAANPSPEIKAIMMQTHDLIQALSREPVDMAVILYSKGFISYEVYSKMMVISYTPTEKAAILIEAVNDKIEITPSKFTEFLEILSGVAYGEDVAERLHATYQSEFDNNTNPQHACTRPFVYISRVSFRGGVGGTHPPPPLSAKYGPLKAKTNLKVKLVKIHFVIAKRV